MSNKYYTPINVTIVKFQTADGRKFNDPVKAKLHGQMLHGEARVCTECGGGGRVDPFGDGREFHQCSACNGTGYQVNHSHWGAPK